MYPMFKVLSFLSLAVLASLLFLPDNPSSTALPTYNMELIGVWGGGPCWALALQDTLAVILDGSRLELLRITGDLSSPEVIGAINLPTRGSALDVSDGCAFIAA